MIDCGEGDVLGREVGRGGDHQGTVQLPGMVDRPLERLHPAERTTHRGEQVVNA
ncbi:MAG: hypothetical protein ACO3CR_01755 [Solirubrobacterales bacterium]